MDVFILPKAKESADTNSVLIKIPIQFFTKIEKLISTFVLKHKRLRIVQTILNKKALLEESPILILSYTTEL